MIKPNYTLSKTSRLRRSKYHDEHSLPTFFCLALSARMRPASRHASSSFFGECSPKSSMSFALLVLTLTTAAVVILFRILAWRYLFEKNILRWNGCTSFANMPWQAPGYLPSLDFLRSRPTTFLSGLVPRAAQQHTCRQSRECSKIECLAPKPW